jgi:arginine-tRNA-protein transferase
LAFEQSNLVNQNGLFEYCILFLKEFLLLAKFIFIRNLFKLYSRSELTNQIMFAEVHRPQSLSPEELDKYLEQGWFRMGQTVFTTSFLNFRGTFYDAVWLRIKLDELARDKTQNKLIRRNEDFRVVVQPLQFTIEKEELFERYRQNVSFEASPSLSHLLFGKSNDNIFHTYELNVYDDHKLIAVGIFDLGKNSAAGITSFYDPTYKRFSLGKYLIFLKMDYCQVKGLTYFYPGYFVPGYSPFDYKLTIGKSALYYFNGARDRWLSIQTFSHGNTPLTSMRHHLNVLHQALAATGLQSKILQYEFFDANLIPDLQGMDFFDFPVFLYVVDVNHETVQPLVVYDVKTGTYVIYQCAIVWSPEDDMLKREHYYSHLLKITKIHYESARSVDIADELHAMRRLFVKI